MKELRELMTRGDNRRAGIIQLVLVSFIGGVFVPLRHLDSWFRWEPTSVLYSVFFAGIFATGMAADAFAGERERRTLETLLTTPASEFDILLGKAGAVVIFGITAALAPWLLSLALGMVLHRDVMPGVVLTFSCVWLAGCASFLFGMIGIATSLRFATARASQQVSSLLVVIPTLIVTFAWYALRLPMTTAIFCVSGAASLPLGLLALFLLSRRFRRHRLFIEG